MTNRFLVPDTLTAIFLNSSEGILLSFPDGRIVAANPAACAMLGRTEQDIIDGGRAAIIDPEDPRWIPAMEERERTGHASAELRMRRGDGSVFEAFVSSSTFTTPVGKTHAVVVFRDITDQVELRRDLQRQATVDYLTGVYNRRGFLPLAEHELLVADRDGTGLDLMCLDVDRFKEINDLHGHDVGDEVLRTLGHVLREECRASDIICRWGGDEFLVMARRIDGHHLSGLAQRIQDTTRAREWNLTIPLTLSIGIASRRTGETLDQLLKRTDDAMYVDKQQRTTKPHNHHSAPPPRPDRPPGDAR